MQDLLESVVMASGKFGSGCASVVAFANNSFASRNASCNNGPLFHTCTKCFLDGMGMVAAEYRGCSRFAAFLNLPFFVKPLKLLK